VLLEQWGTTKPGPFSTCPYRKLNPVVAAEEPGDAAAMLAAIKIILGLIIDLFRPRGALEIELL
jgi:hypothetical protein